MTISFSIFILSFVSVLGTISTTAIRAKLSLAKSICFLEMVIVSDLDPLGGFLAQSMVSVFIQSSRAWGESAVSDK